MNFNSEMMAFHAAHARINDVGMLSKTRLLKWFWRRNCQIFSAGFNSGE
jgi:hypothetical protein